MSLDVVRGKISNILVTKDLINFLEENGTNNNSETLYVGYPLTAGADNSITVDALLVSDRYGLVAFIFSSSESADYVIDKQGELYYQLINTLTQYQSLRRGRLLAVTPNVITLVPKAITVHDNTCVVSTINELGQVFSCMPPFDNGYYPVLVESLQKIASIKPRKKRDNVKTNGSKGDIIKNIEKEIANLDQWQKKAALEIVEGPQRIRGLAGSGKTIVLALKAAYLHSQNRDWDIVITYYTRSLWQQYQDLIRKFVFEFSRDDPDWTKLHLLHAWGSQSEKGLYSEISKSANLVPINYANAKMKYGREHAFSGICKDLDQAISFNYQPQYDMILIDEAQDLPAEFFKLAYKCVKEPKRIVWAYDELQNLGSATMPSIDEMFGTNEDGSPVVQLKNEPDEPLQDIILPVCYRNPPWLLALAHSLGFGIYRKPLVQHFDTLDLWENIGYKKEKGELSFGSPVTLSRSKNATPEYFYKLLKSEDVIETKVFENEDLQYDWIAKEIRNNIDHDELDPDDILVIFPSVISASRQYQKFAQFLNRYSISSMMAGVTNDRDIFRIIGSISCSAIYRAKGNEAPMVYIVNADYCYEGIELIKLRNIIFTAITRSRAWVKICGIGEEMIKLAEEIKRFEDKEYLLDFTIPTESEMEKLRVINRDRTSLDTKRIEDAQKGVRTLLDLANKGEIDMSKIPEFNSLMQIFLNSTPSGDNDEEDK